MPFTKKSLILVTIAILLISSFVLTINSYRYLSLFQTIRLFASDLEETDEALKVLALIKDYSNYMNKQGVFASSASADPCDYSSDPSFLCWLNIHNNDEPDPFEGWTSMGDAGDRWGMDGGPVLAPVVGLGPDSGHPSPYYATRDNLTNLNSPYNKTYVLDRDRLVSIAESQLGLQEDPRSGNNRGEEIEKYYEGCKTEPGNSWCFCFVWWSYRQIGEGDIIDSIPLNAWTIGVADWAKENNGKIIGGREVIWVPQTALKSFTPQKGDIVIASRDSDDNASSQNGHTYMVRSVNPINRTIETIEGNVKAPGSSVDGVISKTRSLNNPGIRGVLSFGDIKEEGSTSSTSSPSLSNFNFLNDWTFFGNDFNSPFPKMIK